jgi:hypothetical protein
MRQPLFVLQLVKNELKLLEFAARSRNFSKTKETNDVV